MSKNTGTSELINYFDLGANGDVGIAGSLDINTIANATTDTDTFLVSDTGIIKYRTGAQLLSDIGAQAAGNYVTTDTSQAITANKSFTVGFSLGSEGSGNQTSFFRNTSSLFSGSGGTNIFGFNSSNNIYFGKGLNNGGVLQWNNTTLTRYYTLPDADGTIALTSSLGAYLPLAGGTLTGALNGTSANFNGNITLNGAVTRNINFYNNTNSILNAQIQYDQISSNTGQLFFGTNNAGTFSTKLTISNTGAATFDTTSAISAIFNSTNASGGYLAFRRSGTNIGYLGNSAQLGIGVNNALELRADNNLYLTTTSGTLAITSSGNVLIGTPSDAGYKFDVNGISRIGNLANSSVADSLLLHGKGALSGGIPYGDYGSIVLSADSSYTSGARRFLITNAFNATRFAIIQSVDSDTTPTLGAGGAVTSGNLIFSVSNTGTAEFSVPLMGTNATFSSNVTSQTNLGFISENSSQAGFVADYTGTGALKVSFSTYNNTMNIYNETNGYSIINFVRSSKDLVINPTGGNVGIGVVSPNYSLTVSGTIQCGYIALGDILNNNNSTIEFVNGPNSTTYASTGNIAYYGNTNLTVCYGGGNVLIGTLNNTGQKLQVNGSLRWGGVTSYTYSGVDSGGTYMELVGTTTATRILRIQGVNDAGTSYSAIKLQAGASVISFETADIERMRITSGGYLKASNDGVYLTGSFHELLDNTSNGYTLIVSNKAASPASTYIQDWRFTASTPNNSSARFWNCEDATANRGYMRSNGGLANYQANDTNLSDERTKKDIEPLESYWDKFKAIEIVKFKYKDQTHDDFNIGVIAQQVEAVAPEFVDVDGWDTKPKLDEEGNEIVSEEEPLKSIYTADLHHATIKVLQEAMAKIEKLETEIDKLKNK